MSVNPVDSPPTKDSLPENSNLLDVAGSTAVKLSLCEIGLGSLLHGFRVPMAGHILSWNQIFFLSRASHVTRIDPKSRTLPAQVSLLSSLFKSLSPAGKKLTPMLAIAAQGVLFNTGTLFFGRGIIGICAGALAASVWSFLQPLVIYWIIFGNTLFAAWESVFQKIVKSLGLPGASLIEVALIMVTLNALIALGLSFIAQRISFHKMDLFEERLMKIVSRTRLPIPSLSANESRPTFLTTALGAGRDVLSPFFLFSVFSTVLFFAFAEAPTAQLIWGGLRPLAVGFLFFFALRIFPMERLLEKIQRKYSGQLVDMAVQILNRIKGLH